MYLRNKENNSIGEKNMWIFMLIMLLGVVLGGFLGEILTLLGGAVSWLGLLRWLNYGFNFGFSSPFTLDLGIVTLTFGFTIKFTVCGLLGLFISFFIYKRI